eukprot:gnl/TRDRNA2_/TRDRNA2_174111_c1_seq9.p1 gnl/TRDRNA2_/TRDRNA2_174111_c1~~gnl/TRDRNA2_/TRDRNA2_174111_c1_seq9.p1  ORF type:complete len:288 (-),score=27.73 gnl/TRDRNA2_/TRDRNA2_174111_c1_seq9:362-1225(-)
MEYIGWPFCSLYKKLRGLTFVDVGAHIGTFSIPMALCLETGEGWVVAVEAMPLHVQLLRANFRANFVENAVVFPYAVGDSSTGSLLLATHALNSGLTSAVAPEVISSNSTSKIVAPLTTLDEIYRAYPEVMRRVLVMKLDVEGFEGRSLLGAQDLMGAAPPCLLMVELNAGWMRRAGTPMHRLFNYLESQGYSTQDARNWTSKFRQFDVFFWQKDIAKCISERSGYTVEAVRQAMAETEDPQMVGLHMRDRWSVIGPPIASPWVSVPRTYAPAGKSLVLGLPQSCFF